MQCKVVHALIPSISALTQPIVKGVAKRINSSLMIRLQLIDVDGVAETNIHVSNAPPRMSGVDNAQKWTITKQFFTQPAT